MAHNEHGRAIALLVIHAPCMILSGHDEHGRDGLESDAIMLHEILGMVEPLTLVQVAIDAKRPIP